MPRSSAVAPGLIGLERLLDEVLTLSFPADSVISRFFKSHPNLGSRDRALLADAAWFVLRHRLRLTHFATQGTGPMARRFAVLSADELWGREALAGLLNATELDWLGHVDALKKLPLPLGLRESLPDWLIEAWQDSFGNEETEALARALNLQAPLDLRVNTIKAKPAEVIASLSAQSIEVQSAGILPEALRVAGRPPLQKTQAFTRGWFEVQDLGSQLMARLLSVRRGQFVVDLCAGAGGKTLALGALLHNTGRLYALDVSAGRLAKLKPRLARSGLSNVWPSAISGLTDERLKRLSGKADAVLIDAPCSGSGTFRRNPDLKWRHTMTDVREMTEKQLAILKAGARLVGPKGRLVYGTCSLLACENQGVVARFLAENPQFSRASAEEVLGGQRIDLPQAWRAFTAEGDLWLLPHRTGTDGFFASVLQKD